MGTWLFVLLSIFVYLYFMVNWLINAGSKWFHYGNQSGILSVCLSLTFFLGLFDTLFISLLPVQLFMCLSVCLSICLSVCLHIFSNLS